MNRTALALAIAATAGAALFVRSRAAQAEAIDSGIVDSGTETNFFNLGDLMGLTDKQTPQQTDSSQEEKNLAAFLVMIRAAEGTNKAGGYGALFGWPAAGRSFDPEAADGHPKQFFSYTNKAGKTLRTSAAGAYQITFTTWAGYQVPFRAWALLHGYEVAGFTPATQDAFAAFLLSLDGALGHVKAGRVSDALAIARKRWASLPGAGYDQPERSQQFVLNAYQQAGGKLA